MGSRGIADGWRRRLLGRDGQSIEAAKSPAKAASKRTRKPNRQSILRGGVAAIAIAAALIAWLATRNGDGESESPPVEVASRIVTGVELREAAARLGQPIYWAGPMPGKVVELKELGEAGGVQILYLPAGTEAGEGSPRSLTVGSYPMPDPTGALEGFAKRPGAVIGRAADGRQVVASEQSPTSVYFASPDNSVQVEVYSLSLRRAMSLARSDTVQPAS